MHESRSIWLACNLIRISEAGFLSILQPAHRSEAIKSKSTKPSKISPAQEPSQAQGIPYHDGRKPACIAGKLRAKVFGPLMGHGGQDTLRTGTRNRHSNLKLAHSSAHIGEALLAANQKLCCFLKSDFDPTHITDARDDSSLGRALGFLCGLSISHQSVVAFKSPR